MVGLSDTRLCLFKKWFKNQQELDSGRAQANRAFKNHVITLAAIFITGWVLHTSVLTTMIVWSCCTNVFIALQRW